MTLEGFTVKRGPTVQRFTVRGRGNNPRTEKQTGRTAQKSGNRRKIEMEIYRSPMEKILKQLEDSLVITNPKDRYRAFRLKLIYRCAYWADRVAGFFHRR